MELQGSKRHPILVTDRILNGNDFRWPKCVDLRLALNIFCNYATLDWIPNSPDPIKIELKAPYNKDFMKDRSIIPRDFVELIKVFEEKDGQYNKFIFAMVYDHLQNGVGKNYVLGHKLANTLLKTEFNVEYKNLPDSFEGLIYFPNIYEELHIKNEGVFVKLHTSNGKKIVCLTFVVRQEGLPENVHHIRIPFDEGASLDKILLSYEGYTKIAVDYKLYKWLLQAVIYITHTSEDLTEAVNAFARKRSKNEVEKNIYTSQNFTMVGFNFEVPRVYREQLTLVNGFWRWQPYGPQLSKVKLIFIEPHLREYGKNDEAKV